MAKEQRIIDLEQELKQVREAVAAKKKKLEDELSEEKRKATEATAQFNTLSIVGQIFVSMILLLYGILTVAFRRLPQQ
jgi:hypothetical protein